MVASGAGALEVLESTGDGEGEGEGEGREEGEGTVLSVVDWEITRRGIGATDVAQFAAEAYLLDRFCGGKGLLGAFVEAYVRAAGEQPEREAGVVAGASAEEFVRRSQNGFYV